MLLKSIVFLSLLLTPTFTIALEIKTDEIAWKNKDFWVGATSGLLLHELGHVVVLVAQGQKPTLNNGSIVYPRNALSKRQLLQASSAGFQTQWLLSEFSFAALKEHDNDSIVHRQHHKGLIAMHIAISTAYLFKLKDMPTSDLYAASLATGISANDLALSVFLPAALDSYRLLGHDVPSWVGHLSLSIKSGGIAYVWLF